MPHTFANTLFSEPVKEQRRHGSRQSYERFANSGRAEQSLGPDEIEFIAQRDSSPLLFTVGDLSVTHENSQQRLASVPV